MESMQSERLVYLDTCPSCGVGGPKTKFCLNCGSLKLKLIDDYLEKSFEDDMDTLDDLEVSKVQEPETSVVQEPETSVETVVSEFESFDGEEPDVLVREVLLDLEKSINLILWIVDLQLRGEVEEDDFNNLFGSYEYRFEQNLNRMYKILEIAREIKPMKKEYTEAKLRLAELELKKKIGDLSDEEYNVKATAYQWDIDKYEKMMVKRKSEVSLIENLNHIMTEQEILEMKKVAESIRKNVEEQLKEGTLNKELGDRIEKILEEILSTPKSES